LRCTVEYDGTAFAGFQKQSGRDTVQGALEAAIGRVTNTTTAVVGAGRTDAGVHAIGQVIHFQTEADLPVATLQRAVNACLPGAVRLKGLEEAEASFHARFSAKSREYRYVVENSPVSSPLWRTRAYHFSRPLDVDAMDAAAADLRGRHDFAAFGAPMRYSRYDACTASVVEIAGGTERTVFEASCWRQRRFVHLRFVADAFLRHMVRMVIGTLLRIGTGALFQQAVARLLQGDRSISAGPAVPPHGLYLVHVCY
jgi:tRNA pseudouridine38-40 synthase